MLPNRTSPEQNEWSTLALIGTMVATLAVLYLAREIFIPFAFALTLSFVLTPLAAWLQRIHLGRVPSVMIVMIGVVACAGVLSWMVANELIDVVDHLPAYSENINAKIKGIRAPATGALGRVEKSVA
jgi:predicted PurR-regulated permease PerM